jgi:hypothetical protein
MVFLILRRFMDKAMNLTKLRRTLFAQKYSNDVIDRVLTGVKNKQKWALEFTQNNYTPLDAQHWEPPSITEEEETQMKNMPIMDQEDAEESDYRKRLMEVLSALLALIRGARNRGLASDQIAWICGFTMTEKGEGGTMLSLPQLAARWGVSKQAFSKGAFEFAKKLNIRPCGLARNETARLSMKNANIRKTGKENVLETL